MKLVCTGCQSPLELPDLAHPQIMNLPSVSIIVVEHPQKVFCLGCKKDVTVGVKGANLALVGAPLIPVAKPGPVILAPGAPLPPFRNGKS